MKKIIVLLGVVAFITTTLSFRILINEDPWKVPEKYEKLKNPVPA